MENSLIVTNGSELAIMPVMNVDMALARREQITAFIKRVMVREVDYGVIPGTGDKPALLKSGAEKLTTLFGLSKKFEVLEKDEDWDGKEHDGEPFFYYIYRCGLYRGDLLIAEADGSCNSHESKYRYRKAERICPSCGQANIRKSKQGGGWYCWQKTGGCGATFKAGDRAIEGQEVGRIFNPDVADQANTILKMAQKRALVAATLLAVNASEYFSTKEMPGRDEDDQPVEADHISVEPEAPKSPEATVAQNSLNTLDDLLFQLHLEFGLQEAEARAKLKELKFNGLPRDAEARRQRLNEMYRAVKEARPNGPNLAGAPAPVQAEIDF